MKEEYFNTKNISAVCSEFLAITADYRKGSGAVNITENTALLILDMQNYFYSKDSHARIPSIEAIIPNINKLIDKFEELKLPIIFTKHHNNNITPGSMLNFWGRVLEKGSNSFNLIDEIRIPDNSIIIEKTQYDAFYETNLDNILIRNRIENLVVCGVFTHLCVETTIRGAFCHDYLVYFPIDATATYNKQFHLSSVLNLGHGFAYTYLTDNLIKLCLSPAV